MKVSSSRKGSDYLKVLVYSPSGIGKTRLIVTCPNPIIISSEKKLVSISGKEFPDYTVLQVDNYKDLKKALKFIKKNKRKEKWEWVAVDSLSHIAERLIVSYRKEGLNLRDIYGTLAEEMTEFLDNLLNINDINIYCIAKAKKFISADGDKEYYPAMPGRVLPQNLPYMFDEVFALRIWEDEETGKKIRYLQTEPNEDYEAKDSSGKLKPKEKAHLGKIHKKVKGK